MFKHRISEWDNSLQGNSTNRKFLLFSPMRCGSTTLQRLLNCHFRIQCLEEPFNPFNYGGNYLKRVTDFASLDETLRDIWQTYNGIKHTWCPDGWPFDNRDFNEFLLMRGKKVLYLRRRNLLRRLISVHISNQTGIWGVFSQSDRNRLEECKFPPIDIDATKSHLDCEIRMLAYYRRLLVDSGLPFLDLWYEELYSAGVAKQEHIESLNRIFTFLGEAPIRESTALSRAVELLDERTMKLNSVDTYRRIPGIEEVDRQCGSHETGWLFEDQISHTFS
jgi:hypothetical protein